MKLTLLSLLFVVCASAIAQDDWQQILQRSEEYYRQKTNGIMEYTRVHKNALKEDTTYDSYTLTFQREKQKMATIDFGSTQVIYTEPDAYFIYPQLQSYSIGRGKDNQSDARLRKLPYWDPAAFFKEYHSMGEKRKVQVKRSKGEYWLFFSEGKMSMLVIDTSTYRIDKTTELIISGFGSQYNEYRFNEVAGFNHPDSLSNELASIKREYSLNKASYDKEADKKRELAIKNLVNSRIDKDSLLRLIAGDKAGDYQNHYLLLDFFYQSCLPCVKAIPLLNELHATLDTSRLKIVGVDPIAADEGHWEKFIKRYNIQYSIVDGARAVKVKRTALRGIEGGGYPVLVLINPDGTIEKIIDGYSKSHIMDVKRIVQKS